MTVLKTVFKKEQKQSGAKCSTQFCVIIPSFCALIVLLSVLLLIQTRGSLSFQPTGATASYERGYKEGFQHARELSTDGSLDLQNGNAMLEGVIKRISGNEVSFSAKHLVLSEKIDGVGIERTANIGPETRIVIVTQKTDEDFKKEQEAYSARSTAFKESNAAPSPFIETESEISNLKEGDYISVDEVSGKDLTLKPSFVAGTLRIMRLQAQTPAN